MLRIHEKLNDFESKMLLQVHDELVFDAKKSELDALTSMIKTEMEQAYKLQVPLLVDVGTGMNWLEAHWFSFFGLLFTLLIVHLQPVFS